MLRAGLAVAVCVLVAGCSSTDVAETGVPAGGRLVAPVAYAPPPQLPPSSYTGYWFVADDTERDCTVAFSTAPRTGLPDEVYAAQPTGECVASLRHIAGWGIRDGGIVLYSREGQVVGSFARTDVLNYGGELTIDTGQTFAARLRKIA